ncbi:MAG: hypothetical protein ACE14L_09685 [Terriglobales bacterium]
MWQDSHTTSNPEHFASVSYIPGQRDTHYRQAGVGDLASLRVLVVQGGTKLISLQLLEFHNKEVHRN